MGSYWQVVDQTQESCHANTFLCVPSDGVENFSSCTPKNRTQCFSLVMCCIQHTTLETVSHQQSNSALKGILGERKGQMRFPVLQSCHGVFWAYKMP